MRIYGAARLAIGAAWVFLFVMLLHRHYFVRTIDVREAHALRKAREERFMGIYFGGERIGYVRSTLSRSGDTEHLVNMHQEAILNLNVMERRYPVNMRIDAELTGGSLLRSFEFTLKSPFYEMTAEGAVSGKEVRFTLDTGKEKQRHVIRLAAEPYLSTGERKYLLDQGLKPGDRVKIPYFDPVSLTAQDTVVTYKGRQKILVSDRVHNLHHFVELYSGIPVNTWLDDGGMVVKEESPSGFVFVSEPEFKAMKIVEKGQEILSSVSVPATIPLESVGDLSRLSLRITVPEEGSFDIAGGRQTRDDGVVSVVRERIPDDGAPPCAGNGAGLASTPYVQADHALIRERSREIVGQIRGGMPRVRALAEWVFENLEQRPVLGIPDAVTTLRTMVGDCNEHAALFAALARSSGIPTRIVSGVMYNDGAFFYHAWNEVCIGGAWISLDTTRNQIPADVGHVRFVEGEVEAQVRIGALIGRLGIEVVEYE